MAVFQGFLFLVLGAGLLLIAWRSLSSGWLPCGPNGFKGRLKLRRDTQAAGYWLLFVGYSGGGLWLVVFALRLLLGTVEPLPLR